MNEASVTLQQVILLNRLVEMRQATVSELAAALGMSLPSVSQMVDRLHRLEVVTRAEAADDRRKKQIALTAKARSLLERLHQARALEFDMGVSALSAPVRADLTRILSGALLELEHGAAAAEGSIAKSKARVAG